MCENFKSFSKTSLPKYHMCQDRSKSVTQVFIEKKQHHNINNMLWKKESKNLRI